MEDLGHRKGHEADRDRVSETLALTAVPAHTHCERRERSAGEQEALPHDQPAETWRHHGALAPDRIGHYAPERGERAGRSRAINWPRR